MKRWRGEHIPYGPFQLGKWRTPINIIAIIYTFFTCLFLLFPTTVDPTVIYMNWSIVLVGGIFVISILWWFIDGKKNFVSTHGANSFRVARQRLHY